MKSGMLAAEATFAALKDESATTADISSYQTVGTVYLSPPLYFSVTGLLLTAAV